MSINTKPLGIKGRISVENGELSGLRLKVQNFLTDENDTLDEGMIKIGDESSFSLRPERVEARKALFKQIFEEEYEYEMTKRIEDKINLV